MRDNHLEHYGILGMHWGVRRTPEELARARGDLSGLSKEQRKEKLNKSTNPKTLYKYRKELSDAELRERLNRIDMERKLESLAKDKSAKERGKKVVKAALSVGTTASAFYNLYNSPMGKAAKQALKKKVS